MDKPLKLILIFVSVVVAFIIDGEAAFSQNGYHFRKYLTNNGLSDNEIHTLFVDKRGGLWASTQSGFDYFDGYQFRPVIVRTNDANKDFAVDNIQFIFEDHLGIFWLRLFDNYLFFYNPYTETFSRDHEILHKNINVNTLAITGLVIDRDSNLWIGSYGQGIYKYNKSTDLITQLLPIHDNKTAISHEMISNIRIDSEGNIITINAKGTIEVIDPTTNQVKRRIHHSKIASHSQWPFYHLHIDKNDDCWFFSRFGTGLFFISKNGDKEIVFTEESKEFKISHNAIMDISEDANGFIWVGTDHGGVNIIDKRNYTVHTVKKKDGIQSSLSHNVVKTIVADKQGGVWLGTYKGGINYYHPLLFQFGLYKKGINTTEGLPVADINCFTEDKNGNLWIGTNEDGLLYFDRAKNKFERITAISPKLGGLSGKVIVRLFNDSKGRLWIGTFREGLWMYDGQRFQQFKHNDNDDQTLANDNIWAIFEDSKHQLWVGTLGGGLDLFDETQNRFIHFKEGAINSVGSNYIQAISEDKNGNIWVGSSYGIDIFNAATGRFTSFSLNEVFGNDRNYNSVTALKHDKRGWIWMGTRQGLVCYDAKNNTFRLISKNDGLSNNLIMAIEIDKSGNIWVSTRKGLSALQVNAAENISDTKIDIINYYESDGLQADEFGYGSSYMSRNGELIFGGINGFNIFNPANVMSHKSEGKVMITDFKIHNNTILVGEKVGKRIILQNALFVTSQINLTYKQDAFSISFAANDYINPQKLRYQYILEGINNDWVTVDALNRNAVFTNIGPGEYIFKVRVYNESNGNHSHETSLLIVVEPPFYATQWAYFVYFLILAIIVFFLIRIVKTREQWKFQRLQYKLEHERLLELEALKTKFFTNVSHEFRTPLTLIMSPIDKLIRNSIDPEHKMHLNIIRRNAHRLMNLVNQLLDFRKLENIQYELNLWHGDIIAFLRDTAESFVDLSESKNIPLGFETEITSYHVAFDRYKIEKILFNLLSNAFKFTPKNGTVAVYITLGNSGKLTNPKFFEGREYLEIRVADSGVGIPADELNRIFDRFFQSNNAIDDQNQGSGIGLSIAKEFVQMHHGTIHAESVLEKGTVFVVRIPFEKELADGMIPIDFAEEHDLELNENEDDSSIAKKKQAVLIIEDNNDLRLYLRSNLNKLYTVYEATNGAEGWEKAIETQPALIVSDIMMPIMDGLQFCKKAKSDPRISHIPIILLTAKGSIEHEMEGLEAGADAYITKPFSYEMLELKMRKLIDTRLAFQHKLQQKMEIAPGEIGITSLDEKFIQKTIQLVEQKMTDPDFSVEELSQFLGMSRSHLYNKLISLTGKSPIEFIRIMRIKRAAQLLEKSQMQVSSIAYEVGFNSTKYLDECATLAGHRDTYRTFYALI